MAMRGRRSSFRTQHSFRPTYQDFQPKSEMKENQEACFLHIQLPGFTKERIRIQFEDSSRTVKISGERPIDGGNRRSRFRQSYTVPQICDTNKIQSNFSQGILTITMPKKLVSQEKAPIPPNKAQDFIPPKSVREEELGDKKSVASSSSSSKDPNGLKGQKSQEEALYQRHFDGQKAEKELREKDEKGKEKIEHKPKITMVEAPKRQTEDNKTQKDQEEIGPKPTSKVEAQKGQEESEMKSQITMVGAPERQIDGKSQRIQEESESELPLKIAPKKSIDDKPQKGQEEIVQKPKKTIEEGPRKQTNGKPQRVLEETQSEPPFKIVPRMSIDDKSQKVQEEIVQKPKITMAEGPREQTDSKPQRVQEETEPEPTLKIAPKKSIDDKPKKGEEEIVQKPKIAMEEGPRKQTNGKLQRVLEVTESESTLKISPRKSIDDKPQKGQEEIVQKPKITMVEGPREQTDSKPQRVQEETEPEPTLKIAPRKSIDDKPKKGEEEIVQKPKITIEEGPRKQTNGNLQRVLEVTESESTLKISPRKSIDDKPQKGQEEIVQKPKITMAEGPRKQTYGKPQRFLEETEPEPPSKIAPKKSTDDNPLKGQEEIVQKPEITMVESSVRQIYGKPQGIQEEIKQNITLTTRPKKQANQKIAGKRDEDAQPCDSRKPEEGVEEKSMVKEKEIRSRREIAKEDELFAPKTLAKVNNHNNDMIGTIEKGIKEVVTSASQALTRIAEGKWDNEDKPLLINMGVSALVLATLGMYAFYRFSSSERT